MSSHEFYRRWRNGEIYFGTERIEFPEPADKDKVVKVNWDSLPPDERCKIEREQKEIFDKNVEAKLSELKENFTQKTTSSRAFKELKDNEISKIKTILFKAPPIYFEVNEQIFVGDLVFLFNDILDIQSYVKTYILNTQKSNSYRFVLAEKFPFQKESFIQSEIYAEILWQYKEWIECTENEAKEINPFPHIFVDFASYEYFLYLKKNFVRSNCQYADYSFLYYELKETKKIHLITGKAFLQFLSEEPFSLEFAFNYEKLKIASYRSESIRQNYNRVKTTY